MRKHSLRPLLLILLTTFSISRAFSRPISMHWIGTAGDDETVRLRFSQGKVLVNYVSTTTAQEAGGPLPDETFILCRLPQGNFQGSFKPKAWNAKVSVVLTRTRLDLNSSQMFKGEVGCVVDREWKDKGGNFSVFRLFPLDTRRFRARATYFGKASNRNFGSFAPTISVRGAFAYLDARSYADGIDRAHDITIVCDLPNGRAFGLVRGARWANNIVKIPLRWLSRQKSATPVCVIGVNGNFDFAPDSMASSPAFQFALSSTR